MDDLRGTVMRFLKVFSNEVVNKIFEQRVGFGEKITEIAHMERRRDYITKKYAEKAFISKDLSQEILDENLITAVKSADMVNIYTSILQGADINLTVQKNRSLIHLVAVIDNPLPVYILCEHGIDPVCIDESGKQPIHYAYMRGVNMSIKTNY